jgi:1-acyl-sn-glycerol-3-phosphate acyltransferase
MLYGLKLAIVGAVSVAAVLLTILLGTFDRYGKRVYTIGRFWSRMILAVAGVTVKVRGLDHLDAGRQYVFIVNHQSNLDIPVLVRSLKSFQLRWLAKKELLSVPFFGWAIVAGKHIVVDRTDRSAALDSFTRAKQLISGGVSLVIFPEGTRSTAGRLLPFKRGGFLLAAMTGTPIVPITINGSGAVLPPGAWRLRNGAVEVVIHAPIPSENHRPGTLRALSDHVREVIASELPHAGPAEPGPARLGAVQSSIDSMALYTEV